MPAAVARPVSIDHRAASRRPVMQAAAQRAPRPAG